MPPIRAVLFDFAGTLAVPAAPAAWLRALEPAWPDAEIARVAAALDAAGAVPGGPYPASIPETIADDYARRDTDAATHRRAYEGLLATVVAPALARRLYDRVLEADGWVAYPDAAPVLAGLRERGVAIGVATNVGFELRPVAAGLGLLDAVDAWTSSLEVGAAKPDPRLFAAAAAAVGAAPEECLFVGDNATADNGGVALGMRTLLLPMSPPGAAHGLDAVLRLAAG
ncbi:HAD-IA family hydrolase [Patulibacter sp. SYSU D01012]|uniref:HAD family hydrolase n=1 Tax=Patulibacter sp. SYSU D01012 TaxID=2817381 RepID=UPI001B30B653